MGSLSSRPSVPAPTQPQVVFIPSQPTTSTPTTAAPQSDAAETGGGDSSVPQSASEAREQSLLRRSRGRFGTVQTSFRGLLGLSNTDTGRKTLLGE